MKYSTKFNNKIFGINPVRKSLAPSNSFTPSNASQSITSSNGFTIVELLVVIVVIGILAAITIVSYTGITQKAAEATLQSDLSSSKKQLSMYEVAHGYFPTSFDANGCPSAPTADTEYCLKSSSNNAYDDYTSDGTNYSLIATNTNGTSYYISDESSPALFAFDPADWLAIGTQVWAKSNLNVGTMVTGATTQTNNSNLEKYCYNNLESNCTTYGALYQWDEAMQYVTTEGTQGICPAGSHIPSDSEYSILITYLGGDAVAGAKMKVGGTSGFEMPFAGYRTPGGSFGNLSTHGFLWSGSESGALAWGRYLFSGDAIAYHSQLGKTGGYSVRCLGN